jgi:DNA mismatch repair ATPase MutS
MTDPQTSQPELIQIVWAIAITPPKDIIENYKDLHDTEYEPSTDEWKEINQSIKEVIDQWENILEEVFGITQPMLITYRSHNVGGECNVTPQLLNLLEQKLRINLTTTKEPQFIYNDRLPTSIQRFRDMLSPYVSIESIAFSAAPNE